MTDLRLFLGKVLLCADSPLTSPGALFLERSRPLVLPRHRPTYSASRYVRSVAARAGLAKP